MAPTLLPGDWLLIECATYARRSPTVGEVVLVFDPRDRSRELIKRVGRVANGMLQLSGDNRAESTDSATFGWVPAEAVEWRVVGRYWPPSRIGPVRSDAPLIDAPLGGEPACTSSEALITGG